MSEQSFSIDLAHQSASAQELSGHDAASFSTVDYSSIQPTQTFVGIYSDSGRVYRLTLTSTEEMELISWGVPSDSLPNAIVDQAVSDPYLKTLDIDLYCFNPEQLTIRPIVMIQGKPVFVNPIEFIGALEPFVFIISYSYDEGSLQHTFDVYSSRAGNNVTSVVSTIDGTTSFVNGTYNPTQISSGFYLYDTDFTCHAHRIKIVGTSLGQTKEYEFNFTGTQNIPMNLVTNLVQNGNALSLSIDTNKRHSVDVEIVADDIVIHSIIPTVGTSWPIYYTCSTLGFDAGSHNIAARITNKETNEVITGTLHPFTGNRPVATDIVPGSPGPTLTNTVTGSSPLASAPLAGGARMLFYKFNATVGQRFRITSYYNNRQYYVVVAVLNSTGQLMARQYGYNNMALQYVPLVSGTYYIEISAYDGNNNGNFSTHVDFY